MPEKWDSADFFAEYSGPARAFVANSTNWELIEKLARFLEKEIDISGQVAVKFLEDSNPYGRPENALCWRQHGID